MACAFGMLRKDASKAKLPILSFHVWCLHVMGQFPLHLFYGLGFGVQIKCLSDVAVFIATHPVHSLPLLAENRESLLVIQ